VREPTITRFPDKIYDETAGDELRIPHIRHARRRPWKSDT
jgi:hypothetical protein